ncbi:hypothetical protein N7522_007556 [Penicillium canescens]|uniref:Secreted protein n=1 Tax=Penicillium canescens TaxID=5083 RepID=A0AAD6I5E0_PENCN|nr:uncharacterized protein N7446_007596 [Penicillium canescens]KAJ6002329.1 hypothetical protein N7522_007556 [Penicillium canescens]KAJ6030952.1 hypothetical protein N7460_010014 [Penicillium canescens]KAJ6063476.1 hypothetical protein N7446_007596 [Penicillium canescens]
MMKIFFVATFAFLTAIGEVSARGVGAGDGGHGVAAGHGVGSGGGSGGGSSTPNYATETAKVTRYLTSCNEPSIKYCKALDQGWDCAMVQQSPGQDAIPICHTYDTQFTNDAEDVINCGQACSLNNLPNTGYYVPE